MGGDGVNDNSVVRVFSEGTKATETPEQATTPALQRRRGRFARRATWRAPWRRWRRELTNFRVEMVYRTDRYDRGGDQVAFSTPASRPCA